MTTSSFFQFPRKRTKSHLESHMESHLNLALCSLEITQNQVKDQSKQIEQLTSKFKDQSQQLNDQSQQIERLVAKNTEQSQQLHNQSQQLNDHSQQLNDQSQQIERLVAKNTEQSQQIAILKSTVQGLVRLLYLFYDKESAKFPTHCFLFFETNFLSKANNSVVSMLYTLLKEATISRSESLIEWFN